MTPSLIPRAPLRQAEIDALLVEYGRAGLDVVRLKGGDPFVFGRGGEEALDLATAGVPFTVTPGVSSIAAVPAAALIPVTHRGVSDRVTIANGHGVPDDPEALAALARDGGTIVLFMGLERLFGARRRVRSPRVSTRDAGRGRRERDAAPPGDGRAGRSTSWPRWPPRSRRRLSS